MAINILHQAKGYVKYSQNLSQFLQHKQIRILVFSLQWDGSPLQVFPTLNLQVYIYTPWWPEHALQELSVLPKNTMY